MNGTFVLVSALAVLASCARAGGAVRWVADGAAGEVLALDGELLTRARISVAGPERLAASGGALWVVSSESDPPGERLVGYRTGPEEGRVERLETSHPGERGAFIDVVPDAAGGFLVLERVRDRNAETLLWALEEGGRRRLLGVFPQGRVLGAASGRVLVGCASGELITLGPSGAVRGFVSMPGPIRALAPGPERGEWWVLFGSERIWLALLERGLETRWCVRVPDEARGLAPVVGQQRIWLGGAERAVVYGFGGVLEQEVELPAGEWHAVEASESSVVFLGAGALLELTLHAGTVRYLRTQGGFRGLTDWAQPRAF